MSKPLRWIKAAPAPAETEPVLAQTDVQSWREAGFAFVSNLLPDSLIDEVRHSAVERLPPAGSDESLAIKDFGSNLVFPSQIGALNDVTLHPRVMGAVAQLLGVEISDLRLSQSDLWPKYGRAGITSDLDNTDQRIHIDYPNHTLAHPAEWSRPEAVEMIIYYDDVEQCGGATAVVPREGPEDPAYPWPIVDSPGIAGLDYVNDRDAAEASLAEFRPHVAQWRASLYEREVHTFFKPGDVLFYRHDTWHRGTPPHEKSFRLVQNITYRRAECEWISTLHIGWAWSAYRQNKFLERLIARASLAQRAVLGFPQPGSSYWSQATIAAIVARHGVFGMDMTPYREGLER